MSQVPKFRVTTGEKAQRAGLVMGGWESASVLTAVGANRFGAQVDQPKWGSSFKALFILLVGSITHAFKRDLLRWVR